MQHSRLPPLCSAIALALAVGFSPVAHAQPAAAVDSAVQDAGPAAAPVVGTRELHMVTNDDGVVLVADEYVYVAVAGDTLSTAANAHAAPLVALHIGHYSVEPPAAGRRCGRGARGHDRSRAVG